MRLTTNCTSDPFPSLTGHTLPLIDRTNRMPPRALLGSLSPSLLNIQRDKRDFWMHCFDMKDGRKRECSSNRLRGEKKEALEAVDEAFDGRGMPDEGMTLLFSHSLPSPES